MKPITIGLSLAWIGILVLVLVLTACSPHEEGIYFADLNLKEAVREAIGITEGPIYPRDLEGLTSLSAPARSISNLTGLEYATSLTELWLSENQISDISPLANLTNLTGLPKISD